MKFPLVLTVLASSVASLSFAQSPQTIDDIVVIEAEHFAAQHLAEKRRWLVMKPDTKQSQLQDADSNHADSASGNAYIELLPDTRVSHHDPLIHGESFAEFGGQAAILSYPTYFEKPGKYIVWVRAFSTGSEDNGVHVGLNGEWPKTGERLQFCQGKYEWTWSSAQRTDKKHCGEPKTITLKIPSAGVHNVMISMREDGFEFDKMILSRDKSYTPDAGDQAETLAPEPALAEKTMLFGIENYKRIINASHEFAYKDVGDVSFLLDEEQQALFIDSSNKSKRDRFAYAAYIADKKDRGLVDITLVTLGDTHGSSKYQVFLNDSLLGAVQNPAENQAGKEYYFAFKNILVAKGDRLTVSAMAATSSTPDMASDGRWRALVLSRSTEIDK